MLRRTLTFVALLALGLSPIVACGDDDDAASPPPGGTTPLEDGSTTPRSDSGNGGDSDGGTSSADAADEKAVAATLALTGPWQEAGDIPAVNTCDGANESPALSWSGAPEGTKSFAIVMRDESLTTDDNYHWVIYDIPPSTTSLDKAIAQTAKPASPAGARQTKWSFGDDLGYSGPCPPSGKHTYAIALYAVDKTLDADFGTPNEADAAIQAAKLASAKLTGTYSR